MSELQVVDAATKAIHRSFEPMDRVPTNDPSAECAEWLNDRMNEWFNA
jgi:hypothetical protein